MSRKSGFSSQDSVSGSVLVADGVRLTREGIAELLQANGVQAFVCSAAPDDVIVSLRQHAIDLVVCNAATVDLVPVVAAVRSVRDLPVVAMSVSETVADVALCAELNLAGFVLADDSVEDLLSLIETAEVGHAQCPAHAIPMLMQAVRQQASSAFGLARLTARESEIANLLQEGLANKEIALRLGITTRTVKNHLHHVYDKLGVHSRGEVAARLRRRTLAPRL